MGKLGVVGLFVGMAFLAGCGHHARCAQSAPPPPPQVVIVQVPAGSTVTTPAPPPPAPQK